MIVQPCDHYFQIENGKKDGFYLVKYRIFSTIPFMKRRLYILLGAILIVITLFSLGVVIFRELPNILPSAQPSKTPSPLTTYLNNGYVESNIASNSGTTQQITIYLVAINDNGKSGMKVGCGDSLIPVRMMISPSLTPLTAAINQLLTLDVQYYGQPPLYNSLYNSALHVDAATITNGKATIKLYGSVQLGGECDDPRASAQLEQTALQFPTVKSVDIFINGIPMKDVFTEKGA